MLRNILKFNLGFGLVLLLLAAGFFAHADNIQAATKPAMTLKTPDKEFTIAQTEIEIWKSSDDQPNKFISFEPEKNARNYILDTLGIQKSAASHLAFQNYNASAIYQYLKSIEPDINRDSHDAVLKIENDRAVEFDPGTNGRDLDIKTSIALISAALDKKSDQVDLSVNEIIPQRSLAETNDLGITELIAAGDSNFAGSPKNRIFNIKVGAKKEEGVIIQPGQEFSFNKYLGEVDGEHGFLPELVIKKTGTVPEFGGGLCQVSSTMFRAAMNSGFPITERRNHSYAVQYYAPQGTDATIYPGVQDLKFVNDTPTPILIWPSFPAPNQFRFSIYGTKDARKVAFEGPNVYDRKSDGSMKATWTRLVTMADGLAKKDVFRSVYQSPALFHKVEEYPAQETPSPAPPPTSPAPPVTQTNTSPNQTPTAN